METGKTSCKERLHNKTNLPPSKSFLWNSHTLKRFNLEEPWLQPCSVYIKHRHPLFFCYRLLLGAHMHPTTQSHTDPNANLNQPSRLLTFKFLWGWLTAASGVLWCLVFWRFLPKRKCWNGSRPLSAPQKWREWKEGRREAVESEEEEEEGGNSMLILTDREEC